MDIPELPLSMPNRDAFRDLFAPARTFNVGVKNQLELHTLHINAANFALEELFKILGNASLRYILARNKFPLDDATMVEVIDRARKQFRAPDPLAGEGGEILLYAFLESHLGAPKVLSKMELKTNTAHYIYGADGVHALKNTENDFELIFGESKMYGDGKSGLGKSYPNAVKKAFASMAEIRDKGFDTDSFLVETELLKEVADPQMLESLKQLLLGGGASKGAQKRVHSFGVLICYELDFSTVSFLDLSDQEAADLITSRAIEIVEDNLDLVRSQIERYGLDGYRFHVYAVPFMLTSAGPSTRGIEGIRFDLADRLKNGKK